MLGRCLGAVAVLAALALLAALLAALALLAVLADLAHLAAHAAALVLAGTTHLDREHGSRHRGVHCFYIGQLF